MTGWGWGIYIYLLSLFGSSRHFAQLHWQGAYAGAASDMLTYTQSHAVNYQLLKELQVVGGVPIERGRSTARNF